MSRQLEPRARAGDPATSKAAAARMKAGPWRSHMSAILGVLWRPMTPREIAKLTGLTLEQVDRRRLELIGAGRVRLTGEVRDGCQVWEKVLPTA
jgi:hypothetical protein